MTRKSGYPGDPGKTFDEMFDWRLDEADIPFWRKGLATFDIFLGRVFRSRVVGGSPTDYVNPGWLRTAPVLNDSECTDSLHRLHAVADFDTHVHENCELRGISFEDLRKYLGLPLGLSVFFQKTSSDAAMARTISGCLRHSGSVIPPSHRPIRDRVLTMVLDARWIPVGGFSSQNSSTR